MISFSVPDMTCGHCVNAVTKAVRSADQQSTVSVNLDTKRVEIRSPSGDAATFKAAIEEAGYHPVELTNASTTASAPGGGCCGSCS